MNRIAYPLDPFPSAVVGRCHQGRGIGVAQRSAHWCRVPFTPEPAAGARTAGTNSVPLGEPGGAESGGLCGQSGSLRLAAGPPSHRMASNILGSACWQRAWHTRPAPPLFHSVRQARRETSGWMTWGRDRHRAVAPAAPNPAHLDCAGDERQHDSKRGNPFELPRKGTSPSRVVLAVIGVRGPVGAISVAPVTGRAVAKTLASQAAAHKFRALRNPRRAVSSIPALSSLKPCPAAAHSLAAGCVFERMKHGRTPSRKHRRY